MRKRKKESSAVRSRRWRRESGESVERTIDRSEIDVLAQGFGLPGGIR